MICRLAHCERRVPASPPARPARASSSSASSRSSSSSRRRASSQLASKPRNRPRSRTSSAASGGAAAGPGSSAASANPAVLDGGRRALDVEPRAGREVEPQLAPAADELGADAPPHARQERAERAARVVGGAVRPQRVDQLVARDGAVAVEREVAEQDAAQPARELALAAPAVDVEAQLAAQLDADHHRPTISRAAARVEVLLTSV